MLDATIEVGGYAIRDQVEDRYIIRYLGTRLYLRIYARDGARGARVRTIRCSKDMRLSVFYFGLYGVHGTFFGELVKAGISFRRII